MIAQEEFVDLLERAGKNDLAERGIPCNFRGFRRASFVSELSNDLIDENVFDVLGDRRALVRRNYARVCCDAEVDARLLADRLDRFPKALVDCNRDGWNSGGFRGYACTRTRGGAAASTGISGNHDVAVIQLELLGQFADHVRLTRSIGIAELLK